MSNENDILWSPSKSFSKNSNLSDYIHWLGREKSLNFKDYSSLWEWSTREIDSFWVSIIEYFDVIYDGAIAQVRKGTEMPGIQWFEGLRLSYAEHIFRSRNDSHPSIIFQGENGKRDEWSWKRLESESAKLADHLRELGISKGDAVVGFLPTIPEASVSFLATNSIGAVWSSTSPDFGVQSVIDRFKQIKPKVLICTDGYWYGGKEFDKADLIRNLLDGLPSVQHVVQIPYLSESPPGEKEFIDYRDIVRKPERKLTFERVPFDHPIWVLYSSGTTGLPKALTHSHGGILLEHLKYLSFHNNVKPGDRCFWYTTTGWMMWNYIQASWLCGGTVLLYDGSPAYPDINVLWEFAADTKMTHFGTSAGFITANMKASTHPGSEFDLEALISVGSTGSPLPPEGFEWLYKEVKSDLWVASISGGSDVCSAFVGGNPLWPVRRGEIQCRALGCKLESFDESGKPMVGQVGEMVISEPMPSMPVYFWNDDNFKRYRESYFEMYPGIWRHGDWTEITESQGVIIYGRSDSTLNRGGVRIGTSEIYRAIEPMDKVRDSLIICIETGDGNFYMPLFVQMKEKGELSDELKKEINLLIRSAYSPRHVPDEIIEVPAIPYTISGKKVETPVKKILLGKTTSDTLNRDALRNPESLDFYINFAKEKLND